MSGEESIKKLPIGEILKKSGHYFEQNLKIMLVFTLLNYVVLTAGFYSWKTALIWPLLISGYVFWSFFFRYYFKRKPYLQWRPLVDSMIPSTKIVVLGAIFATALVVLPFAPLFMGFSADFNDRYTHFLQTYMQESDLVDLGLNVILVLISPLIFYRPFLGWISALIGRSGALRTAWAKTRGNYWEFMLMALIFNFGTVAVQQLGELSAAPVPLTLLVLSPVVVYFNIVLAQSYEFFFMDID